MLDNEPLVPVAVTLSLPTVGYVHVRVTEPDVVVVVRVTVAALYEHDVPPF